MQGPKDPASDFGLTRRHLLIAGAASFAIPQVADTAAPSAARAQAAAIGVPVMSNVSFQVNGQARELALDTRTTLLDALREHLHLTGSKKGCDHGQCGACTVLIDDRRAVSCLTLALAAEGRDITTVEGLAKGDNLHPMQQAFIEQDAFQCGYCTPGQIMSAIACVKEGHANSDEEIREYMSGNICRCAAYPNIVAAVKQAAPEIMKG